MCLRVGKRNGSNDFLRYFGDILKNWHKKFYDINTAKRTNRFHANIVRKITQKKACRMRLTF